jgi:hypothetical protein
MALHITVGNKKELSGGSQAMNLCLSNLLPTKAAMTLFDEVVENTAATFTVEFYAIKCTYGNGEGSTKDIKIILPAPSTSIAKKSCTPEVLHLCSVKFVGMLNKIKNEFLGLNDELPAEVLDQLDSKVVEICAPQPEVTKPKSKVSLTTTVRLRDAVAVGQRVFGTSSGSVYVTCAVSDRIRMAVRPSSGKLSVRVEGNPSVEEKAKLTAIGLSQSTTDDGSMYMSMHLGLNSLPVPRVLGALIMGLEIEFDSQVTNVKDLNLES